MSKKIEILILAIIVVAGGLLLWRLFGGERVELPQGESVSQRIVIEDGEVVDVLPPQDSNEKTEKPLEEPTEKKEEETSNVESKKEAKQEVKNILVTDGVRHSVPLDEILGGGPPKDGIPSIDDPKFISPAEASKDLGDNEPGIALSLNGVDRFYPFQILVWHEIVNDTLGGQRVLVTYCPLCLSGIVFDPVVNGERVEFGTSGKLWQSNLVMYDRKTDSLWSQILGEAIVGEMTGTKLTVLPSDMMRFGEWKKINPEGEVLSRDTGATRFYGRDPYGDYYTTEGTFFPVREQDNRLKDKDFILGIVVNGKAKAYWPESIKEKRVVEDEFEGKTIVAQYQEDLDAVRLFEKKKDGKLERINPFPNFWFSWVAAHPETALYK